MCFRWQCDIVREKKKERFGQMGEINIRRAAVEDAAKIVEFYNYVGGETSYSRQDMTGNSELW